MRSCICYWTSILCIGATILIYVTGGYNAEFNLISSLSLVTLAAILRSLGLSLEELPSDPVKENGEKWLDIDPQAFYDH